MTPVIWWVVGIVGGLVGVPAIIAYFLWEISFNYKVQIAKQVGKDPNDVVWVNDRFKVREKMGVHTIIFRNQLSRTPSVPYRFWSKYTNKQLKYDEEQWKKLDLSSLLKRKLFLYQGLEGEFRPMEIVYENNQMQWRILSQDNRRWVVSKLREEHEFTLSKKQQLIIYASIVIAFIILAICFIMMLIYLTEASQNICSFGTTAPAKFVEQVQGAVGG
jgi:hypothetical protein